MLPQWTAPTNTTLARIPENAIVYLPLPLDPAVSATTSVITGSLPPGLILENNIITGSPFPVNEITLRTFVVRASNAAGVLDRTFSIYIENYPTWTENNNYNFGTFEERNTIDIPLPVSTVQNLSTSIISGSLPPGLRLDQNKIRGTILEVSRDTTFTFVVRANLGSAVLDRTFVMTVQGPDNPQWITAEGKLPVGSNEALFILDNSLINYQLLASDTDLPAGDTLEYYIAEGEGELPPGIKLTKDGRITGIVDPILALDVNAASGGYDVGQYGLFPFDFGVVSGSGLDTYYYDTKVYDYSVPTRAPKKLNRTYEFIVTVSDNVSFAKRKFSIYVVSDDFLRADNTIMKAADGVFTSDNTYSRVPLWLTPSDLGIKRANNYITIYLDVLDTYTLEGDILFFQEPVNPGIYRLKSTGEIIENGSYEIGRVLPYFPKTNYQTTSVLDFEVINPESESRFPPGVALDSETGEVAGIVPYQPAVTKDYRFTIRADRFDIGEGFVKVFGTYNAEVLSGNTRIRIAKLPRGTQDGIDDLQSLIGREIPVEQRYYTVKNVFGDSEFWDEIELSSALQPTPVATPITVKKSATTSQDYIFANTMLEQDKKFYVGKQIRYSDSEYYLITSIYPYIEYKVYLDDSTVGIELVTSITGPLVGTIDETLESLLGSAEQPAYVSSVSNIHGVVELTLVLPATAENRNTNFIKSLFHTADSSPIILTEMDYYERIQLEIPLSRSYAAGVQISFGTYTGGFFSITFPRAEVEIASKKKTFTIKLLGEVDSIINWITDADLGTLNANRISTLFVKAETSVPNAVLIYNLVSGKLPYGLALKNDGEIVGKVPINGTASTPGLTFFDSGNTTFDGATTTMDRVYNFTVLVRDRFGFSAVSREFTLVISDADNLTYSNIYMKPFLSSSQRQLFLNLMDNSKVIDPRLVYRPSDPNFGIQKDLRCLVFSGIETQNIDLFVGAVAKNHKRKRYLLGDVKTAIAKKEGTNEIIYEIVYVELRDPAKATTGKTRTFFNTLNTSGKITADSIRYEAGNDTFKNDDKSPWRFRPNTNTITADIDAVKVSQNRDSKKYISNIDNMRERIRGIEVIEDDSTSRLAKTSRDFLPLWMRTAQGDNLADLDYILALPLVYCKVGQAEVIKDNILNYMLTTGFSFTQLDFDIDRYIIDSTTGNSQEQYILFANYTFNV